METPNERELNSCTRMMQMLTEEQQKTKYIEPNMAVMETWLSKKNETKETQIKKDLLAHLGLILANDEDKPDISKNCNKYCIKTFHNKSYNGPDTPSIFMEEFIESTYNLFQNQQKRIAELERIIKKT